MTQPTTPSLDIAGALRAGWRAFLQNIGPLLIVALVVWAVTGLVNWWAGSTSGLLSFVLNGLSFLVAQLVSIVWIALALAIVDGKDISSDTLLPNGQIFVAYVIASVLFSVMAFVGLVLLIIPGIIVMVIFGLYGYALIDHGLDPLEALRHSARITSGHRWELVAFGLLVLLINVLGLLVFIIGVLVTSAVSLLAAAHVYRQLDGSLQPAS